MNGAIGGGRPMMVPDAAAVHAQSVAIEAQKELAALQLSQNMRLQKATHAINFVSMRSMVKDGTSLPPESQEEAAARAEAFKWIAAFFETDTTMETGQPVVEQPASQFASA